MRRDRRHKTKPNTVLGDILSGLVYVFLSDHGRILRSIDDVIAN